MGYLTERLLHTEHEEGCCCGECGCEDEHDHEEIVEKSLSESEIEEIISEKYSEKDEKTKHFIYRGLKKYGLTYTYYNSVFVNYSKAKIKIYCPIHGEFERTASQFLNPKSDFGCPKCSISAGKDKLKLTTEEFIKKAKEKHKDKFDYSKTIYKSNNDKIIVICKEHGEFVTTPHSHLHTKVSCPQCALRNSLAHNKKGRKNTPLSTEEFIERAKKVHGEEYDYSLVNCHGYKSLVKIICREHGEFEQSANSHLSGAGCPECANIKTSEKLKLTLEGFIERAKQVHGDKYDYSKTNYQSGHEKVEIICPIHGSFFQKANSHLSGKGCPICGNSGLKSKEKFIEQANLVHGVGTYDYGEVEYKGSEIPVKIFDPLFNEFFYITPHSHLKGFGNPKRGMSSGERLVHTWLKLSNINFQYQFSIEKEKFIGDFGVRIDFRIEDFNGEEIFIEYNGEQHYSTRSRIYKNDVEKFKHQLRRDQLVREFCENNGIRLIEVPYTIHSYTKLSDFLTKTIIEKIDPCTIINYSDLYVLGDLINDNST